MTIHENPFFQASQLPFQAPPFNLIGDDDYEPAISEGIRAYLSEINVIAGLAATPTFDNTYVALEGAGQMLKRVLAVFGAMASANTNDRLQQIEEKTAPELAKLNDAIKLNGALFARLQQVYDQRLTLDISPESKRLIEVTYQRFVLAGANLTPQDKQRLSQLNQEAASLSTRFTQSLLTASKQAALAIADETWLDGLSPAEISAAGLAAKERGLEGQWLLVLQNTTQQPQLQWLKRRETRQALFAASVGRAERGDNNDTRALIIRLAQIRAQQANLVGFADYASWALQDQMAKTPTAALAFMQNIVPAATTRAKREAADIQALIDDRQGGFALAPWDWQFYAEQVRKMKYELNDSQIRPFFPLDRVLQDGVFYAAGRLYGITLTLRTDIPVYQSDVSVYEVFDRDGTSLALFYTDLFQRDNKGGGAWMGNFIDQSTLMDTRPVIYNVANLPKPPSGQVALLSWDDVITLFHEFGHTLHGLFATQQYASLSGTATPRDFVEFPSQFNEHWADDPEVFDNYAKHYKTGEPMPEDLREKIRRAARFNKGYDMTELLAAALLDMHWHSLAADRPLEQVDEFESEVLAQEKVNLDYVPPRYRSSFFQHIWGGGYAAGYYAYLWTQMLADDAFDAFRKQGGLTAENGRRFRQLILSRGNSEDLDRLYRTWRGAEPSITPMLTNRGLQDGD